MPSALPHTFRFPVDFPSFLVAVSLGLTEKKPSNRPCCFVFKNLVSLSAPFLTLSSLYFDENDATTHPK